MATTIEEENHPFLEEPDPSPTNGCCSCCYKCICLVSGRVYSYFKSYRHLLFALFGGQILSALLCGTGVSSQALETFYGIAVPTTQLFLAYLVMAVLFFPVLVIKRDFLDVLKENWWRYIILGAIDVEANFLVVLAYKYTTLTSIQLLDSFTIVTVLVLSFIFLRVRYLIIHFMGVAMCLVGIISLVLADLSTTKERNGPANPLLGDILCIAGSVLYAVSNVSQEYLVKNHSVLEWLGFIGFVGSFVSGIQLCFVERLSLASAVWNSTSVVSLMAFVVCLVIFYSLMPFVLKASGAVVVNLSLLTADIFTLVFGIFLFKFHFSLLYILSFIIIIVGVFIFNLKPPPVAKPKVPLKDLKTRFKEMKLRRRERSNSAELVGGRVTRSLIHSYPPSVPSERRTILVRGPLEPALSERSYSTHYSQSMSYSYRSRKPSGATALESLSERHQTIDKQKQAADKQKQTKLKERERKKSEQVQPNGQVKGDSIPGNGHCPGSHN